MVAAMFALLSRRVNSSSFRLLDPKMVTVMRVMQTSSQPNIQPQLSLGADEGQLKVEANALLKCKWTLDKDKLGVQKTFNFPTFAKALVICSPSQSWRP